MPTSVIVGIIMVLWVGIALLFWCACVLAKRRDREMGIDD